MMSHYGFMIQFDSKDGVIDLGLLNKLSQSNRWDRKLQSRGRGQWHILFAKRYSNFVIKVGISNKMLVEFAGVRQQLRMFCFVLLTQQSRFGASPNMRSSRASHSVKNHRLDKNNPDFNWLERWMAGKPWDKNKLMEDGEGTATPSMTPLKSYEGVKVKRNNVTTKVSAKPPHSSVDPGENSTSTSSTSASVSEEGSHFYKPGYLNSTASAKAKFKASSRWHNPIEDFPFQNQSMSLSETRSIADSNPSVYYSQDLYQSERRDRFRTRHHVMI